MKKDSLDRERLAGCVHARSGARSCKWHTLRSGNRMKATTKKEQAFQPLGKWKGFTWLRKVRRAHSCALGRALGARSVARSGARSVRARVRACAKGIPRWVELEWKEPLKEQTFKPVSKWKGFSRQGKASPARSCALGLRIQDEVLARGLLQMIHHGGRKLLEGKETQKEIY